jgi:hypothetical protein
MLVRGFGKATDYGDLSLAVVAERGIVGSHWWFAKSRPTSISAGRSWHRHVRSDDIGRFCADRQQSALGMTNPEAGTGT